MILSTWSTLKFCTSPVESCISEAQKKHQTPLLPTPGGNRLPTYDGWSGNVTISDFHHKTWNLGVRERRDAGFCASSCEKSLQFIGKLHGNLRSLRKMMEILIFFAELELFRNQGSFLTISLAFHCTTKDLRGNIIESPNLSWYPQLNFTLLVPWEKASILDHAGFHKDLPD